MRAFFIYYYSIIDAELVFLMLISLVLQIQLLCHQQTQPSRRHQL